MQIHSWNYCTRARLIKLHRLLFRLHSDANRHLGLFAEFELVHGLFDDRPPHMYYVYVTEVVIHVSSFIYR